MRVKTVDQKRVKMALFQTSLNRDANKDIKVLNITSLSNLSAYINGFMER